MHVLELKQVSSVWGMSGISWKKGECRLQPVGLPRDSMSDASVYTSCEGFNVKSRFD